MTTHRQSKPHSNYVPPRFHGLPQRPNFDSVPLQMQRKPTTICRNYIFWGYCRDSNCNRAHVPHGDMLDLFGYLLELDDCPSELRTLWGRFTRPVPGSSRKEKMSDGICAKFLRVGFCVRNGCPFAHLRRIQIYNSLLPFARPIEISVAALVPEADENLVVKLPGMTNYMTREPSLVNTINMTIQSPTDSFPGCEPTLTASDVFEPRLPSVVEPLCEYTVRLPKTAEPQQASSARSPVIGRQEDSVCNENTVPGGRSVE